MTPGSAELRKNVVGQVQLRAAGYIVDHLKMRPGRTSGQKGPEGFDDGFFGGEPTGEKTVKSAAVLPQVLFQGSENAAGEAFAVTVVKARNSLHAGNIYAN
jgi:hypothetical protein